MTDLAGQLATYLAVRQHTLSTAHLTGTPQLRAEAEYVLGEAKELEAAVGHIGGCCLGDEGLGACADQLAWVRHEIADVVLSATTLAGMLPGGVTVEACIAEKTEADRGRG